MSGESVEIQIQLARVDERLNTVIAELRDGKDSRKTQYEANETLRLAMNNIAKRLGDVEDKLTKAQPTIEEFITIKHKVVGAGKLGKWLWAIGGLLIGIAANSRETLSHWFRGS